MAKKDSLQLHQLISLFTFAVGVNICIGFTANRFRRSGDGEDNLFSGCSIPFYCLIQLLSVLMQRMFSPCAVKCGLALSVQVRDVVLDTFPTHGQSCYMAKLQLGMDCFGKPTLAPFALVSE
ncbi:UNVERIFIED_CONTAM: hypothetical protein K2H54_021453 [Gekko kuhli]